MERKDVCLLASLVTVLAVAGNMIFGDLTIVNGIAVATPILGLIYGLYQKYLKEDVIYEKLSLEDELERQKQFNEKSMTFNRELLREYEQLEQRFNEESNSAKITIENLRNGFDSEKEVVKPKRTRKPKQ